MDRGQARLSQAVMPNERSHRREADAAGGEKPKKRGLHHRAPMGQARLGAQEDDATDESKSRKDVALSARFALRQSEPGNLARASWRKMRRVFERGMRRDALDGQVGIVDRHWQHDADGSDGTAVIASPEKSMAGTAIELVRFSAAAMKPGIFEADVFDAVSLVSERQRRVKELRCDRGLDREVGGEERMKRLVIRARRDDAARRISHLEGCNGR